MFICKVGRKFLQQLNSASGNEKFPVAASSRRMMLGTRVSQLDDVFTLVEDLRHRSEEVASGWVAVGGLLVTETRVSV